MFTMKNNYHGFQIIGKEEKIKSEIKKEKPKEKMAVTSIGRPCCNANV